MTKPVTTVAVPASAEDCLAHTFSAMREEIVSRLFFVLGNQADAQDAAQSAFLNCWRARAGVAAVRDLRAWILRVSLNAAKDMLRNAWRQHARPLHVIPAEPPSRQASPAEALADRETLARVRAALANLRPAEREVFLLRQDGGMTFEQIAARLHAPPGTVKTQMRAALHKLRRVLQPDKGSPSVPGPQHRHHWNT